MPNAIQPHNTPNISLVWGHHFRFSLWERERKHGVQSWNTSETLATACEGTNIKDKYHLTAVWIAPNRITFQLTLWKVAGATVTSKDYRQADSTDVPVRDRERAGGRKLLGVLYCNANEWSQLTVKTMATAFARWRKETLKPKLVWSGTCVLKCTDAHGLPAGCFMSVGQLTIPLSK